MRNWMTKPNPLCNLGEIWYKGIQKKFGGKWFLNPGYMLIPICTQFHYAYGDSPYATFSGSPHVRIWGLPIRGSVSDVSAIFPRVTCESEFSHATRDESEFCMHNIMHTPRPKQIAWHEIAVCIWGSRSIPVCIWGSSESPYAYGDCMSCDPRMHIGIKIDPRMHTEIAEFPVCIWGSHDT